MCHDIYDSESAQGRHPNRPHGISQELQKGGAERADEAMREQAVAYGGHGMLAHSEADVPAQRRITLEISGTLYIHTYIHTYRDNMRFTGIAKSTRYLLIIIHVF